MLHSPLDPPTERGNKYILVMVDYFTNWLEATPMPDMKARTCAQAFITDWVLRMGIPGQLHSNQDTQHESPIFQEMLNFTFLNINKSRTTPHHPESDGKTERANRTLLDLLAKLAGDY